MKWRKMIKYFVWPCLLMLLSVLAEAQSRRITGMVTDASGAPVAGASVVVKGGKHGAVTDNNGNFAIAVSAEAKTLVVSALNFKPQEVPIGEGAALQIRMQAGVPTELNDVIVIGYGSQQKKDLTGAISSVNSKDFQTGAITSPDQLIAGKIAGVSVTPNGGQPGSSSVIRIRGLASLNSNQDPLYIVDGVIMPPVSQGIAGVSSPLDMINPDDIANITVLKDAASTAIYGSRASAGVIIITTKKGRPGKATFNVTAGATIGTIAKMESVLNAGQFRNLVNSTPADSPGVKLLGNANTNWQKQIYEASHNVNVGFSVAGSLKSLPYRISVSGLDQTGLLKTDRLDRLTGSIHLTPHFLDNHLQIELNLLGGTTQSRFANQGAIGSAISFDPTQSVFSTNKNRFGGYFEWTDANGQPNSLATRNPVALLEQYNSTGYAQNSVGNIKIDYELPWVRGLHAIYNFGYDVSDGYGTVNVPGYAAQSFYIATQTGSDTSASGLKQKYKTTTAYWMNELTLNYKREFSKIKSNLDVMGTYGYYDNKITKYNYASYGANDSLQASSTPTYPTSPGENILISWIGRLIYTFDTKYTLSASVRDDGSSKLGLNDRWGTFPTVAASWRMGQENFLKNTRWLDELKFRVSYGVTGNQDGIGDYGYIPNYYLGVASSQYPFGGNYYYLQTPNPYQANLKWETTASENVGFDFAVLNNRISGSIDYYYKSISNLFNTVPVPAGTNFTNLFTINIGDMTDRGLEANLNLVPIRNSKVEWDVNINGAYNKNVITKLVNNSKDSTFYGDLTGGISGGTGQTIQIQTVGQVPYSYWVYQQVYGKNGLPIEGVYVDQNRDGQITAGQDQIHYHSPFAPWIAGFSTAVTYKRWTFTLVARGNFGNWVYNNVDADNGVTKYVYNPLNFLSNVASDYTKSGFYNAEYQSSYYVQNASFVKIDNIGIGYNVGKFGKRTSLRLSANCQNVLVITKYTGLDPEVYGGIDNNIYPRPRNFTVGGSLNF
jgi:TonB-linked SusC/RagA family outer membrane protein